MAPLWTSTSIVAGLYILYTITKLTDPKSVGCGTCYAALFLLPVCVFVLEFYPYLRFWRHKLGNDRLWCRRRIELVCNSLYLIFTRGFRVGDISNSDEGGTEDIRPYIRGGWMWVKQTTACDVITVGWQLSSTFTYRLSKQCGKYLK